MTPMSRESGRRAAKACVTPIWFLTCLARFGKYFATAREPSRSATSPLKRNTSVNSHHSWRGTSGCPIVRRQLRLPRGHYPELHRERAILGGRVQHLVCSVRRGLPLTRCPRRRPLSVAIVTSNYTRARRAEHDSSECEDLTLPERVHSLAVKGHNG